MGGGGICFDVFSSSFKAVLFACAERVVMASVFYIMMFL